MQFGQLVNSSDASVCDEHLVDTDPYFGLFRVQSHAGRKEVGFDEFRHSIIVQQGGAKIKKPKAGDVQALVKEGASGGSQFAISSKMTELKLET